MKNNVTIYAVIKYPKKVNLWDAHPYDFNIYSKQTSNLEKMREYFREIKRKHSESHYVHLVTREKAKEMREKWCKKYCEEQPKLALEQLDINLDKIEEKYAFYI